jgi:hypothetical protein
MSNNFHSWSICLAFLNFIFLHQSEAQTKEYIAIVPTFHTREPMGSAESSLQLRHQKFVLFVYPNAVAVYSESDFINQEDELLSQEFALPSTGHDENGSDPGGRISNGILSIQLWIQGERVDPEFIRDGNEEWYTVQTTFAPKEERKVKALFWAETSLTDIDFLLGSDTTIIANGKRGFLIDLSHASIWNNNIELNNVVVVLKDGILPSEQNFDAEPKTYDLKDSTFTWSQKYVEPSLDDNIFISYDSPNNLDFNLNTMKKLADYIVKKVYDQLLYYASRLDEL